MSFDGEAAAWVGRQYALAGRPIVDCPYDANGTPEQRAHAARFVQGYRDAKPADDIAYTDDDPASA